MRTIALLLAASACTVGGVDDDGFWDDTSDDDGSDSLLLAAGATSKVAIAPGTTDNAERFELLPVAKSEGSAEKKVALQLSPGDLPALATGHRLIIPAELQVRSRCDIGQGAPG